jgi:hypothetical protein
MEKLTAGATPGAGGRGRYPDGDTPVAFAAPGNITGKYYGDRQIADRVMRRRRYERVSEINSSGVERRPSGLGRTERRAR